MGNSTPKIPLFMLPDYAGGGLVNLVASLVESCGGPALHPTLNHFPIAELRDARNVALLIIDGLGDNYLMRRGAGGELARRRRAAITSVFPSTTASAITTSYTGRTPLEHGLTGWYTYFGEAGCVAAVLPFRSRGDQLPLAARGVTPEGIFVSNSIFETLARRSIVVTQDQIIDSAYNVRHCRGAERLAYSTLDQFVAQVETAVKSGTERKFIYAYWPDYDAVSHRFGCDGPQAYAELEKIDAAFGDIVQRLSGTDTAIVATADHGFIDAEECLGPPQRISSMLRFPFCGERRVVYCHVHAIGDFMEEAKSWLGDRADVHASRELVDAGWFGPGTPHPRLAERVGDVALVMRGRYTVKDWTAGEPRHLHLGNHGGTSQDEMMIPVIVETT
jgi:hypothetical protein